MPYEDEFAHYKPLQRVAESEQVKSLLGRARTEIPYTPTVPLNTVPLADLTSSTWLPDFVLAVDGSMLEVPVKNGYPSAAVGYVTVASVLLDVARMIELDAKRPMDPRIFRTLENAESIDGALPGCNVIVDNEMNAEDSFRRALLELFLSKRLSANSETFLDTYEALLAYKPPDDPQKGQKCPYADCMHPAHQFTRGKGEYQCTCALKRSLYSTDALRIHEFMNPEGSNQSMLTETMTVLERVWIVHVLRALEQANLLPILRRLAIVLDGPLAVFGAPAWVSTAISEELARLNQAARVALNDPQFNLMLVGVEKTGTFVEHLDQLEKGPLGEGNALPYQAAVLLSDGYIKQRIIFSKSDAQYGHNTYFGRKAFYKTSSGSLIVFSTPFLEPRHHDLKTADPDQYPRLADVMNLLDKLVSARYRNSLLPIISAHAQAAIPLSLGQNVLEKLARQLMNEVSQETMNYTSASARWAGIGPYYAMFPLPFVDEVVEKYTDQGDGILDPFAGRASSIFSGAVKGRPSIGIEINPVGWVYGQAKLHPASKSRVLERLEEIGALTRGLPSRTGDGLPEFFRWCFTKPSLRFLLTARANLDWRHSNVDRTLMALILVDLHGVRERSFSNQMRQSRAMEPAYSVRWWRARRLQPPVIEPVIFMRKKIDWRYAKGTPETTDSEVLLGDSSRLLQRVAEHVTTGAINPFTLLFTSPPYIAISDYHRDQWLRLWLLGGEPTYARQEEDYKRNFASADTFTSLLRSVFGQAAEVMKPTGLVYVRTDARAETFEATRQVLRESFPRWRLKVMHRPYREQTQTALYGDKSLKPGEKDIILYGPRR